MNILAVILGGSAGAVSRFLLSRFIAERAFTAVPLGTLTVNALGCLAMGFLYRFFTGAATPDYIRSALTIGFLGAFTTFSTYALETMLLVEQRRYAAAAGNFLVQNVLGLVAVVAGIILAQIVWSLIEGGRFHAP